MKREPFEAKQQTTPISWAHILICAIPILGVTLSIILDPENELKTARGSLAVILLLALMLSTVVFLIVRKIKPPVTGTYLSISFKGIRYRRLKLIDWDKIWYLYIEEIRGETSMKLLRIKILDQEKEVDIPIAGLDKNEDQIMDAIRYFSEGKQLQILHKEIFTGPLI
ncbi:hypothetical protein LQ567_09455 [Niabella pedocola]|uniref:DUF304 domain-containing protein n=1 Tax=Niabella pedocola TaxID=1752077 RepID=A0ABS8PRQ9_9BACT|nr:hypothetical protein [Niabella pedocola]MCD2422987.1 hypothetical protein [Niabella pedocola]